MGSPRLCLTFHAPAYAPVLLARAGGHFAQAGLAPAIFTATGPDDAAPAVLRGEADLCVGGPIDIMLHRARDPGCDLVGICAVLARDPFCILGRAPHPDFRLGDLAALRFQAATDVETPWLNLAEDLRRAGLDPASLAPRPGLGMAEAAAGLRAGRLDAAQLFEPLVETLVAAGEAHLWWAGASRGETLYTTIFGRAAWIAANGDLCRALVGAMARAQAQLAQAPAEALAGLLAGDFPALSPPILAGALARYRALGVFATTPLHDMAGFLRLKTAVVAGGWIDRDLPFDACLTNDFAERADAA